MAAIAGMQDFRGEGPPGDMGVFQFSYTHLVFIFAFSGVNYYVALNGRTGRTIISTNCDALLAAILAANEDIYLKPGIYPLTVPLNLTSLIRIWGSHDSILTYTGDSYCLHLTGDNIELHGFKVVIVAGAGHAGLRPTNISCATINYAVIERLWLTGDLTVITDGNPANQEGIYVYVGSYNRYENNYIEKTILSGLCICRTNYDKVINNYISQVTSFGIDLFLSNNIEASSNTIVSPSLNHGFLLSGQYMNIHNNIIVSPYHNGIAASTATDSLITDNVIYNPGATGIYLTGSGDNARNVVSGNIIYNAGQYGIYTRYSLYSQFSNNHIYTTGRSGFLLENSSSYNDIKGNTIIDIDSGNVGYMGIDINSGSYNNIKNNTITDSQGLGIIIRAGNTSNIIKYNNLLRNADGALTDLGTTTKINLNEGYITENRVSATITALNTSIAFAHGCSYTPAAGDIHATLTNLPTTPIGDLYVDTIGAVNATLHCTTPPGAATAIFDISIIRTP